ncbi:Hypothetical predicted protein [Mytilus galloprovincialis]|uniref:C2H2-type domain-containing protein n=1 Tax=Mytilus galloprovincialis TaxID=29158 RepID=A0A8B6CN21_MYTGA|nr:Hypothetical predicted protein [Mytilus galloprovincialis]
MISIFLQERNETGDVEDNIEEINEENTEENAASHEQMNETDDYTCGECGLTFVSLHEYNIHQDIGNHKIRHADRVNKLAENILQQRLPKKRAVRDENGNRLFLPEEWLSSQQVQGLFSRFVNQSGKIPKEESDDELNDAIIEITRQENELALIHSICQ